MSSDVEKVVTVTVYHSGYGCDTGCCRHIISIGEREWFEFAHPHRGEDRRECGEEHVKDLDWENCEIQYE